MIKGILALPVVLNAFIVLAACNLKNNPRPTGVTYQPQEESDSHPKNCGSCVVGQGWAICYRSWKPSSVEVGTPTEIVEGGND